MDTVQLIEAPDVNCAAAYVARIRGFYTCRRISIANQMYAFSKPHHGSSESLSRQNISINSCAHLNDIFATAHIKPKRRRN
jgi:hypothetical protein